MKSSVVNIESIENSSFGTGFVIHSDARGVYVLTCGHVVEDVGTPVVDNVLAKVIAKGAFIDMAVLYVSKLHLEALPLQVDACDRLQVDVIGFSNFNQTLTQKKHIDATLYRESIELHSKEDDLFYTVRKIKADDGFNFDRGNSGSPVICKSSGNVIAMVSNKEGSSLGYAIDIANLQEVWSDMPEGLFKPQPIETIRSDHPVPSPTADTPSTPTQPSTGNRGFKYFFFTLLGLIMVGMVVILININQVFSMFSDQHPVKPLPKPVEVREKPQGEIPQTVSRQPDRNTLDQERRAKEAAERRKQEEIQKEQQLEAERLRLKKEQASTSEYNGFKALVDNNYRTALISFDKAERSYSGFHNAKEIAVLLRKNLSEMHKPLTKRKVFQQIIKEYSKDAPKEFIQKMKKQLLVPTLEIKRPTLEHNKTILTHPLKRKE